jgi:O-antigen/teichoic acid export membrane protein
VSNWNLEFLAFSPLMFPERFVSKLSISRLLERWGLPKHSIVYFSAVGLTFALILGQSLYAAKALGPALYGVWNVFSIALTYGLLAHIGSLNGLAREYPREVAEGRQEDARVLLGSGIRVNAAGTIAFTVIATMSLFRIFARSADVSTAMILIFSAFLLLQGWTNGLTFIFRAKDQFTRLSVFTIVLNGFVLVFALILIPRYKLAGFLLAWLLGNIAVSLLFGRGIIPTATAPSNRKRMLLLLKIGAPILTFTLTNTINWTLDRVLVLTFLDLSSVGYFAVASFILRMLSYFPEMVSQVLYPRWAAQGCPTTLGAQAAIQKSFRLIFWGMPILEGLAFYACYLIPVFLDKYTGSVPVAQALCFGAPLLGIGLFCGAFLGAIGKEKLAFFAQLPLLIVRGVVVGGYLYWGGNLVGVGVASAACGVLFGLTLTVLAAKQMPAPRQFLGLALLPWMLCTVWLLAVEFIRHSALVVSTPKSESALLALLVFALGSSVLAMSASFLESRVLAKAMKAA